MDVGKGRGRMSSPIFGGLASPWYGNSNEEHIITLQSDDSATFRRNGRSNVHPHGAPGKPASPDTTTRTAAAAGWFGVLGIHQEDRIPDSEEA